MAQVMQCDIYEKILQPFDTYYEFKEKVFYHAFRPRGTTLCACDDCIKTLKRICKNEREMNEIQKE